jgi:hypothetical protein
MDAVYGDMVDAETNASDASAPLPTSPNGESVDNDDSTASPLLAMDPVTGEGYLPGRGDGGKLSCCYTEWRLRNVDWTQHSKRFDNLSSDLLDLLLLKAKHKLTQSACEDLMTLRYKRSKIPEGERPVKYAQFLTFLQDQGVLSVENCQYVAYDYCVFCGHLYAGEDHDSPICLNPDCGSRREGNTKTFIYRCASGRGEGCTIGFHVLQLTHGVMCSNPSFKPPASVSMTLSSCTGG